MIKKLKQSFDNKFNTSSKQEPYQQMEDEVQPQNQTLDQQNQEQDARGVDDNLKNQYSGGDQGFLDFSKGMLPAELIQQMQQPEVKEEEQNNDKKNDDNNNNFDFTKAIMPEELVQQMQEEEIRKIAEENAKKKSKKPKQNNEMPAFLTQKICLNEKGENYYVEAAKQAKKQNSTMNKLSEYVSTKALKAKREVKKQFKKLDGIVTKTILEKKTHINSWIAGQVDNQVVDLMGRMEPKIQESIKKSVPYDFMQNFFHDVAINLWKDFTDLIRLELRIRVTPPKMQIRKRQVKGLLQQIRTFILYSLYPADLNVRDHMRRASFMLVKMLQLIPYLGLQPLIFIVILISINKDEEFQLVNYIADYKSVQFITNGLFPCLIAYFHYFFFDYGPGNHQMIHVLIITLITQTVTVWIAYYLIRKSYSRMDTHKEEMGISTDDKGGRLFSFLLYDAICFLIVVLISSIYNVNLVWIYFGNVKDDPKKSLGDLLFFIRTVYAFLSFPFIIFAFPFFVKMLTNAAPSGYDKFGNCIPAINTLQISYTEVPLLRSEAVDIGDILDGGNESDEDKPDVKPQSTGRD